MAEGEALTFDEALQALAAELAREQPTARRALARPQVRAGQLPSVPSLPPRQVEARSSLSPEVDAFMGATGLPPEIAPYIDTAYRIGEAGPRQVQRAQGAIGEAMDDPSLANVANAGAQSGLAAMRPAIAIGSLGAGYAGAAVKDLGLLAPSDAQAETPLTRRQQREMEIERQRQERQAEIDRRAGDAQAGRERANADADAERALKTGAAANDRAEYDRAVAAAERARDRELARDKRFSDTEVGKFYDKTGGYAPLVAGLASGVVSRAGGGPGVSQGKVLGWGGAAGVGAANVPLMYNALATEPDNPKKRGYEAYAEGLPATHPRREEWARYAAGLDDANPIRTAASAELYDPVKLAERVGMGGVEGMLGAEMGLGGVAGLARGASAIAGVPARLWGALARQPGGPATTSAPLSGTAVETNALSPASSAGLASSPSRNGLAGPVTPPQRQLPSPEASPNQASGLPSWASEPPAGVTLPRNTYWDANVGRIRHQDGTLVTMPPYRHPRQ